MEKLDLRDTTFDEVQLSAILEDNRFNQHDGPGILIVTPAQRDLILSWMPKLEVQDEA